MGKQESSAQSGQVANPTDGQGSSRPSPEEGVRLITAFLNIGNRKLRERVIKLAEELAQK